MGLFLTRQPLINRQGKITATRLQLHATAGEDLAAAAEAMNQLEESWPQGLRDIFVSIRAAGAKTSLLDWIAPANVTLEISGDAFVGEAGAQFAQTLREIAPSLCYDFDAQAAEVSASGVKFRFIGFDSHNYSGPQLMQLLAKTQSFGFPVAFNVDGPQEFKACIEAGLSAVSGWFIKHPTGTPAKQLNPNQAHIVRILNLVRQNADIAQIEVLLKQDVALSYKLLRYVNSVGFGLSCEVQSFRHAVTILGYNKLNKWLSLLLITASKDPMSPALMHTALTRARLMELLGQGLINKSEHDNLFITGAFSMLDLLLGVSMEEALATMNLPEPITDALLGKGGLYGPLLELALLCEGGDPLALAYQADLLGIPDDRFNRALLEALHFADVMEA